MSTATETNPWKIYDIEYEGREAIVTVEGGGYSRYRVQHDTDASDPILESGVDVDYVAFDTTYRSTAEEPTGGFAELFLGYIDEGMDWNVALAKLRTVLVEEYGWSRARAYGEGLAVKRYGDKSQNGWVFVAVPDEGLGSAQGWADEWAMWAEGSVWGVTEQVLPKCDDEDCWVDVEQVWGVFALDEVHAVHDYVGGVKPLTYDERPECEFCQADGTRWGRTQVNVDTPEMFMILGMLNSAVELEMWDNDSARSLINKLETIVLGR